MKGHSSFSNLIGIGCMSSGSPGIHRSPEASKSKSSSEELSEEDSPFFAGVALATGAGAGVFSSSSSESEESSEEDSSCFAGAALATGAGADVFSSSSSESEESSEEDSSFFAGAALTTGSANAKFNIFKKNAYKK